MIDNDIIEWLNNNNNNASQSTSNTLIECVLIISINGILISHKSLIDFCNNNNNNRKEISSMPSYYYGLSKQQFQIIYNNIKSINNNNSNTITTSQNNNDIKELHNSNKIKFNSSITLISENNKCILNKNNNNVIILSQQQQQQPPSLIIQNNNNDSIRKKIKLCNCNNGIRDIDITFFKAWRNIVIRSEILFHTRLYNIHLGMEIDITLDQLSTYKYKSYLGKIKIIEPENDDAEFEIEYDEDYEMEHDEEDYSSNKLKPLLPNTIPSNVSFLSIALKDILQVNSIPNTVKSVYICGFPIKQEFIKGIFPDSITSLEFSYKTQFSQRLSNNWLPSSLRSLKLGTSFQNSIEPNQLPESLTELDLGFRYQGVIIPGSIPSSVKSLDYKFDSNIKSTDQTIPVSTTCLEFKIESNQMIKKGYIPHNVVSINFTGYHYLLGIEQDALPGSLKSLKFCNFFKKPIEANVLPSNLTSIDLGTYNQPLTPNVFPQSITSISLPIFEQPISQGYFYNYKNLKSLSFQVLNQAIQVQTLPPSLKYLNLGKYYRQNLDGVLPNSLETLKSHAYDFKLEVGQLPSSVTSLTVYSVNSIETGSISCNLKELSIKNPINLKESSITQLFKHGIIPESLHTIYLFNQSIDLNIINRLDTYFFNKYIKFN